MNWTSTRNTYPKAPSSERPANDSSDRGDGYGARQQLGSTSSYGDRRDGVVVVQGADVRTTGSADTGDGDSVFLDDVMGYAMGMLFDDGPRLRRGSETGCEGDGLAEEEDEMVMGLASQVLFDDDDFLSDRNPARRAALDARVESFLRSMEAEDGDGTGDNGASGTSSGFGVCNAGLCFQLDE